METEQRQNFRAPKTIPAKNKTPAPVQITAEQLLREAKERQLEYVAPVSYISFKKKKFKRQTNHSKYFLASKAENIRSRRIKRIPSQKKKRI